MADSSQNGAGLFGALRRLVRSAGGRSAHRRSCATGLGSSERVVLLQPGPTPSIDYLLLPHLAESAKDYVFADPATTTLRDGDFAVVVRYLTRESRRCIERAGGHLRGVAYFMDDDLMDARAVAELPAAYREKVRRQALGMRSVVERLCTEFWVSTQYLADRYPEWRPEVLSARPAAERLNASFSVWVCYHGTASHEAELKWLLPVMRDVQAQAESVRCEVFGDHAVYRLFRDLPRVNVLHPMNWPNYLAYTSSVQRHIGLAPLLPGRFNAGRGPTKFFDFARMGAVGLYSDVEPYRSFVRHGVDGLLLPNDPVVWVRAITELAVDATTRKALADAARSRALDLAY